jgi:hypothetical protein
MIEKYSYSFVYTVIQPSIKGFQKLLRGSSALPSPSGRPPLISVIGRTVFILEEV